MALPIYGNFIKKVYADPTLHYSQNATFEFPAGLNLCESDFAPEEEVEVVEETISGAFD